jgi:hypothetical protein
MRVHAGDDQILFANVGCTIARRNARDNSLAFFNQTKAGLDDARWAPRVMTLTRSPAWQVGPANDRHGLGLMLYDGCHDLAAALAHDHDAKALAVLVFAPTPINASDAIIFGPNMAAEPTAVDLNDPA